jgi:hypothetical protein
MASGVLFLGLLSLTIPSMAVPLLVYLRAEPDAEDGTRIMILLLALLWLLCSVAIGSIFGSPHLSVGSAMVSPPQER